MNRHERNNEPQPSEIEAFCGRPMVDVAADIADSWTLHIGTDLKSDSHKGNSGGRIFVVDNDGNRELFRLLTVIGYSDVVTRAKFPSRSRDIAAALSGEVFGFKYRAFTLPFLKVEGVNSSANLQLAEFQRVNSQGLPILDQRPVRGGNFTKIVGLTENNSRAQLTPIQLRTERGFLITRGNRQISPEELTQLEQDLMRDL